MDTNRLKHLVGVPLNEAEGEFIEFDNSMTARIARQMLRSVNGDVDKANKMADNFAKTLKQAIYKETHGTYQ